MTADDEKDFQALLKHGTGFLQQGGLNDALQFLERAHKMRPDNIDAALNLSSAYILNKRFSKALPMLEKLSEQLPKNEMVWTNLGAAYLGNPVLSDYDTQEKAIATFKKALSLNPEAPNVAYNIGLIYYRYRRDYENAKIWFEQAMTVPGGDLDARMILERMAAEEE